MTSEISVKEYEDIIMCDDGHNFNGIVVSEDGVKSWYDGFLRHREDGPAVVHSDGITEEWWIKGKLHREDGPAITGPDGSRDWWIRGKLHREDGPAKIYENGAMTWCLYGKLYSFKEWCDELKLPDGRKVELKLLYG